MSGTGRVIGGPATVTYAKALGSDGELGKAAEYVRRIAVSNPTPEEPDEGSITAGPPNAAKTTENALPPDSNLIQRQESEGAEHKFIATQQHRNSTRIQNSFRSCGSVL